MGLRRGGYDRPSAFLRGSSGANPESHGQSLVRLPTTRWRSEFTPDAWVARALLLPLALVHPYAEKRDRGYENSASMEPAGQRDDLVLPSA